MSRFVQPVQRSAAQGFKVSAEYVVFSSLPPTLSNFERRGGGTSNFDFIVGRNETDGLPERLEIENFRTTLRQQFARRGQRPETSGLRIYAVCFDAESQPYLRLLTSNNDVQTVWESFTSTSQEMSTIHFLVEETTLGGQNTTPGPMRSPAPSARYSSPIVSVEVNSAALFGAASRTVSTAFTEGGAVADEQAVEGAASLSPASRTVSTAFTGGSAVADKRAVEDATSLSPEGSKGKLMRKKKSSAELFSTLLASATRLTTDDGLSCIVLGYFNESNKWTALNSAEDFAAMPGSGSHDVIGSLRAQCTVCKSCDSGPGKFKLLNINNGIFTLSTSSRLAQVFQHVAKVHSNSGTPGEKGKSKRARTKEDRGESAAQMKKRALVAQADEAADMKGLDHQLLALNSQLKSVEDEMKSEMQIFLATESQGVPDDMRAEASKAYAELRKEAKELRSKLNDLAERKRATPEAVESYLYPKKRPKHEAAAETSPRDSRYGSV